MKHHAKAVSAESTQAGGSSRGPLRRASATRGGSGDGDGTGATPSTRLRATLAALALVIAAFAIAAAPALATPPNITTPVTVTNVSYSSAHVEANLNPNGFAFYKFEVSTDNQNWTIAAESSEFSQEVKVVKADLALKGATHYFVRMSASNFTPGETDQSDPPNAEFTTLTADPTSVLTIDNASEVAYTTATATGEIDRPVKSDDVACHFEYITDDQFKNNPSGEGFIGALQAPCETGNPAETPGTVHATGHVPVSASLSSLDSSTAYHLRLAVSNAANSDAEEAASTFTTLIVDPPSVVSIENASEVEYTQAQVEGEVERPANPDPAFDINPCYFEYVTNEQFSETGFIGAPQVPCETELPENPIHAEGKTKVHATLGGLIASTTYHLRLSATNLGGIDSKEATATFTTEGPIPPPSVISIEDATNVTIHEAHLEGEVQRPAGKDPALNTSCRFEYVTDQQFSETGFQGASEGLCNEAPFYAPLTTEDPTPVSADLGNLKADTTFHYRLTAENAGGTDSKDAAGTFTTLPPELPTVTIDPVPSGTYTTAHVSGTVEDEVNRYAITRVEISSDNGASWTASLFAGSGNSVQVFERTYTALQPNTSYLFRFSSSFGNEFVPFEELVALGDVAFSPVVTLNTEPLPAPTVVLDPVTDIAANGAHFSGSVDTNSPAGPLTANAKTAYKTDWHFECTPECPPQPGLSGTVTAEEGSQAITLDAIRLDPHTHYEVKLIATNALEIPVEAEQEFDTPLVKATVTALPGGSDGEGGYILSGIVNPNNSPVTKCEFKWGPDSASYAFKADCSPAVPINGAKPVTVEAHLTKLNPGSVYHFKLFATNAVGTEESKPDREFIPTLAEKGPPCPNEQLREENNSLGLPECRAYEMASYPNKEGNNAQLIDFNGGDAIAYISGAPNLVGSGEGRVGGISATNHYVATRTTAGWETIPDLNGPGGSMFAPPESIIDKAPNFALYSADLRSSIWAAERAGETRPSVLRRLPDGRFVSVGKQSPDSAGLGAEANHSAILVLTLVAASADLSHLIVNGGVAAESTNWGPGVYEFLGVGNDQPRRVDIDNSGQPISSCASDRPSQWEQTAQEQSVSTDGHVIVVKVRGGCGGANPPVNEVWARFDGTTSYDVAASHCNRTAANPGGVCTTPAVATCQPSEGCTSTSDVHFQAAAKDGSRIYFTTTQQLVNGDTDETNDLYACDIPTTPQAPVGKANPCSALHAVSAGSAGDADVQRVLAVSDDGSTAYFTAKGVLADNEDALKEKALPGDENLYVWRTDAANPAGQITFVARLPENNPGVAQSTPDGRYLVLQTAGRLVSSDTDESTDVYRYDAGTGELARVSTAVSGAGGNSDFDAGIARSQPAISDDGNLIVFSTEEPLSPLDGNGEPDAYLWNDGHALGSVAPLLTAGRGGQSLSGQVSIDGSGQDIYVQTAARLNPTDIDAGADVYDVRIDGGFPQHQEGCAGEICQPGATPAPPGKAPSSEQPGSGNPPEPKPCPKGKVRKYGKCVKKASKKHSGKKHHAKKNKRTASHGRGGNK